jgi:hypothetical protein
MIFVFITSVASLINCLYKNRFLRFVLKGANAAFAKADYGKSCKETTRKKIVASSKVVFSTVTIILNFLDKLNINITLAAQFAYAI